MTEHDQTDAADRVLSAPIEAPPQPGRRATPLWRRYVLLGVVLLVGAAIAYVLLTTLLPRWWAGAVGRQAGATAAGGIGWGVFYGFVLTLVALLVTGLAFARRWASIRTRLVFAVAGVLLALPNLLTLGITVGTGEAVAAARRTLDVQAPDFRVSTLIASIAAAVVAVTAWILNALRRRALAQLTRLRAARDAREGRPSG